MSLSLRTASPLEDPGLGPFLDSCFERPARESRLAHALASECPTYDPGLALLAELNGEPAGWALFLPRRFRIRGTWLSLSVSSPFGVLPEARGKGVGRFLVEAGTQALRDRGMRGAVVLGAPHFFSHFGYHPAFDLYSMEVRREDLPEEGSTEGWRALRGDDIRALSELYLQCYGVSDGTEERSIAPLDWESIGPDAHSLVLEQDGQVVAYLRFRVRERLQVRECGARTPAGVHSVLGFLRRLLDEHVRGELEVHVPPTHPVARGLHHRGATCEGNNFNGAALLAIHDWAGVFTDTAPAWEQALAGGKCHAISLGIDGKQVRLALRKGKLVVGEGAQKDAHLWIPTGWGPALLTGQRDHRDLAFDPAVWENSTLGEAGWALVSRLFPGGHPVWSYSPVFELADD